jgi:hypothetical protein
MESEKRAVRDFHGAVNSEAKDKAFSLLPTDRAKPDMVEGGRKDSKFSEHIIIEIPEFKPYEMENKTPMKEMP